MRLLHHPGGHADDAANDTADNHTADNAATVPGQEVDPAEWIAGERRSHPDGRPWVFVNMVTSIDGAATEDGRSGSLGGEGDRVVFSALRAEADVIVAGAETVRAEGYHLPRRPEDAAVARRLARGQAERPRLCVVTRQPGLGGTPPLLDELPEPGSPAAPWQRPIVATTAASAAAYGPEFDALDLGADSVDLVALVAELGRMGLRRVLCEGGPTLLAQLGAAGCVDEWDFTLAPVIAAGPAVRPVHSAAVIDAQLHLDRVLVDDESVLFTRYLTRGR
jgi:riboflavin biosynthesis pyrimidine reductase